MDKGFVLEKLRTRKAFQTSLSAFAGEGARATFTFELIQGQDYPIDAGGVRLGFAVALAH